MGAVRSGMIKVVREPKRKNPELVMTCSTSGQDVRPLTNRGTDQDNPAEMDDSAGEIMTHITRKKMYMGVTDREGTWHQ